MNKRNKLLLPIMMIMLMLCLTACGGPSGISSTRSTVSEYDVRQSEDIDDSYEYENNEESSNIKEKERDVTDQKGQVGLTNEEYVPLVNDKLGSNIVYKANVHLSSNSYTKR